VKENNSKEFKFFRELTISGGFVVSDSEVVKQWNRYRKNHMDRYLDLQGTNLRHDDDWWLMGLDFRRCNLRDAYFVLIPLQTSRFNDSDLTKAKMWEARLIKCNFKRAVLRKASLDDVIAFKANFERADLRKTTLRRARLEDANFRSAKLRGADLSNALLSGADFTASDLREADLSDANAPGAVFNGADLRGAILTRASLERATFRGADLSGAHIYGTGIWNVDVNEATRQKGLVITPEDEPAVLVDDIEVAQFIYLLINRQKLRNVIDTVTRRGVLILGRFDDGGIEPANGGYLPLLFDFPRLEAKTYTETIRTLAGLARFVIVDLSGPSVPQEITATVDLHEIPFVPILERERKDWSMFKDFLVKERVLEPVRFTDAQDLVRLLREEIVVPAEKLIEKRQRRLDQVFGRG
jgi:uncharacterized protein YjbI with pentapeptide repeats